MDRFETHRLVDKAIRLINDQSLAASDKLFRVSSFANRQIYAALFKRMFGKGANSGDEIATKKAVLYEIVRSYTPREKWDAEWMKEEFVEQATEEAIMAEEKKAEAKKVENKPGEFSKNRSAGIGDNVATDLKKIPDVAGMVKFAKELGMAKFQETFGRGPETEKEQVLALQDADKYLKVPNPGLTRMSIGNRLRGLTKKLAKKAESLKKAEERKAAREAKKAEKVNKQNIDEAAKAQPKPKLQKAPAKK